MFGIVVKFFTLSCFVLSLVYCNETNETDNFRIISRNEWQADQPSGEISKLQLPIPVVIIIHTASQFCYNQIQCSKIVKDIQSFHMKSKKFDDIAYNFLVGGDGQVYEGRGWDKQGAHSKGYNNFSLGIAFIGNYMEINPTAEQLNVTKFLLRKGVELEKLSSDYELYAHQQLRPTLSPGDTIYKIIKNWGHWKETMNL